MKKIAKPRASALKKPGQGLRRVKKKNTWPDINRYVRVDTKPKGRDE